MLPNRRRRRGQAEEKSTRAAAALSNRPHKRDENGVPLPIVESLILTDVIEYCNMHVASSDNTATATEQDHKSFDESFIKVDQATLFDIILAANYLDIKGLLDLSCQTVADMIKGKSPEEIRKTFNITNDFTPEEEEEIRRENQWAFE